MPQINLVRTYTWQGKTYGPGPTDVPDEVKDGNGKVIGNPFEDLTQREKEYQEHLSVGGEPIAPVTPSIAGNVDAKPENAKSLNTPASAKATTAPSVAGHAPGGQNPATQPAPESPKAAKK